MKRVIPFGKPMIGTEEKEAVLRVLDGPVLTQGPLVSEFEERFAAHTGAPHAVAASSCASALHLALLGLGIGAGDEVIVPAQSHVAPANAVELCGARPVFVDSEAMTGNVDLDRVEDAITERTRAITVMHYLGMPVDMRRVSDLAVRHGLSVVEDCALALGTRFDGLHAGLAGDAGCFSFYPVKHITTGEGGMLVTKHRELAVRAASARAFGIEREGATGRRSSPVYDVGSLGFNYRLTELAAALGLQQLAKLPGLSLRRRENYATLSEALRPDRRVALLRSSHDEYESSYYCLAVVLRPPWSKARSAVLEGLRLRGVEASIYYPRPVPLMRYYQLKYGMDENVYRVASELSRDSLALPVGPHLDASDMEYVAEALGASLDEVG
jgi:dTDP-4-amino-4,6-dideoxygalactose transaminase